MEFNLNACLFLKAEQLMQKVEVKTMACFFQRWISSLWMRTGVNLHLLHPQWAFDLWAILSWGNGGRVLSPCFAWVIASALQVGEDKGGWEKRDPVLLGQSLFTFHNTKLGEMEAVRGLLLRGETSFPGQKYLLKYKLISSCHNLVTIYT